MTRDAPRRLAGFKAGDLAAGATLVLLLMALLAPVASAQAALIGADVMASRVEIEGATTETGALDLLFVRHFDQLSAAKLPTLTLAAASMDVMTYNRSGYEADTGIYYENTMGATCQEPAASNGAPVGCPETWNHAARGGSLNLVAVQELYIMNIFGTGLAHEATYSSATVTSILDPIMGPADIVDSSVPTSPEEGAPEWSYPVVQGQRLDTTLANGVSSIVLDGDFTIEVMGVDVVLDDQGHTYTIHSGTTRASLAPGVPDNLQVVDETFLRIRVTGGHLELGIHNEATAVEWTGPSAELHTSGPVALPGATGSTQLADGTIGSVQGETVATSGSNDVSLAQPQPAIPVTLKQAAPETQVVTPQGPSLSQGFLLGLIGIGVAVLVLAVAVAVLVRRSRTPVLADVEAAIEAGHYRRAAADAGRILRRRPDMEDAILSRAIALCKAGKPQRVARELAAHLRVRKPTDGSLHYVLGSAYLDMGRRDLAQAAFDDALRLTPSLLTDVQAKMGTSGTTSRTPEALQGPESPHGYA